MKINEDKIWSFLTIAAILGLWIIFIIKKNPVSIFDAILLIGPALIFGYGGIFVLMFFIVMPLMAAYESAKEKNKESLARGEHRYNARLKAVGMGLFVLVSILLIMFILSAGDTCTKWTPC